MCLFSIFRLSTVIAFDFRSPFHPFLSNPQALYTFEENPVLLQETGDVLFGAGRPREGRAVVHELPGHDERVPPLQLAIVALTVVMNPKAAATSQLLQLHKEMSYESASGNKSPKNLSAVQCS